MLIVISFPDMVNVSNCVSASLDIGEAKISKLFASSVRPCIFVILVGLCLCKRNRNGKLTGLKSEGVPLAANAYNLNNDQGSMNV